MDWILIAISLSVIYGLRMLLKVTFRVIERAHESWRASEDRNSGPELTSGMEA